MVNRLKAIGEWCGRNLTFFKRSPIMVMAGGFGLILLVTIWFFTILQLNYEYEMGLENARRENEAKVRIYEEYVRRNLQEADALALFIKEEYEERGGVTPVVRNVIQRNINSPIKQVAIANGKGDLIASRVSVGNGMNIRDRENFLFHKENRGDGLFVSSLQLSPVMGEWFFALSRGIQRKDGSFDGMVSVVINPKNFTEFYDSFPQKTGGMLLIGRTDGRVRAQSDFNGKDVLVFSKDSQLMKAAAVATMGTFQDIEEHRFISYRVMADYPLVIAGWIEESNALADYYQRKREYLYRTWLASLLVLFSFVSILLVLYKQQKTKKALLKSQAQYRQLVEDAECIILRWNSRGRITFINEFGEQFFGYTSRELIEQPLSSLFSSPDKALLKQDSLIHKRFMGSPVHNIIEVYRKDGEKVWCQWTNRILRDEDEVIIGGIGVGMDVTDRFKTEAALAESEKRLRAIIDNAKDCIFVKNVKRRHTLINTPLAKLLGVSQAEIHQYTDAQLFGEQAAAIVAKQEDRIFAGETLETEDAVIIRGKPYFFHTIKVPLRDVNGTVYGLCGVARDVTERKKAEEELKYREALLRCVSECSRQLLQVGDWEEAFLESLRYIGEVGKVKTGRVWLSVHEGTGPYWYEWINRERESLASFHTSEQEKAWFLKAKSIVKGLQKGKAVEGLLTEVALEEVQLLVEAGIKSYCLLPIVVEGRWLATLGMEDLQEERIWWETEFEIAKIAADVLGAALARKMAEEELKSATQEKFDAIAKTSMYERLASVGTMVASVAHEVNQPLNALKVTVDGMLYWQQRGKVVKSEQVMENCQKISRYAERISKIIKHLRAFAVYRPLEEKAAVEINQAVEGALDLVGAQLAFRGIQIRKRFSNQIPTILGDKGRLEEMIINLLVNAMQAMDGNEFTAVKEVCIFTGLEEGQVALEIWDNGTGLSEEILEKLFEPFFTTKTQGMGLGLSIVKSIVEAHKGTIFARNREQGGAFFKVLFPVNPVQES